MRQRIRYYFSQATIIRDPAFGSTNEFGDRSALDSFFLAASDIEAAETIAVEHFEQKYPADSGWTVTVCGVTNITYALHGIFLTAFAIGDVNLDPEPDRFVTRPPEPDILVAEIIN